jgi:tetratricopeptide (TPR) repeat protein
MLYTEPPSYPRPVVEGWANVALALGDFATAEKAYRETLGREPGSGRAYFGLAASLDGLGRNADARDARSHAAKAWANADADLPQVQKLRTRSAQRIQTDLTLRSPRALRFSLAPARPRPDLPTVSV